MELFGYSEAVEAPASHLPVLGSSTFYIGISYRLPPKPTQPYRLSSVPQNGEAPRSSCLQSVIFSSFLCLGYAHGMRHVIWPRFFLQHNHQGLWQRATDWIQWGQNYGGR